MEDAARKTKATQQRKDANQSEERTLSLVAETLFPKAVSEINAVPEGDDAAIIAPLPPESLLADALLSISENMCERWKKQKFSINNKPLALEETFNPDGALIAFIPRAAKLLEARECKIKFSYVQDNQAMTGVIPVIEGDPKDIASLKAVRNAINEVISSVEPEIGGGEEIYPLDKLYVEFTESCLKGEITIGSRSEPVEVASVRAEKLMEMKAYDEAIQLYHDLGTIAVEIGASTKSSGYLGKMLECKSAKDNKSYLDAKTQYRWNIAKFTDEKGAYHQDTLQEKVRLALLLDIQGDEQEAADILAEVVKTAASHYGMDHFNTRRSFEFFEHLKSTRQGARNGSRVHICSEEGFRKRIAQESEKEHERKLMSLKVLADWKKLPSITAPVLDEVRRIGEEHPNFSEVTELVLNTLHAQMLAGKAAQLPPLLLVGPPGIGKTRYLQRIAKALELPFSNIQLAGVADSYPITGLSRYWSGAGEGGIARAFVDHEIANPIFMLDEIDKVCRDEKSDPWAVILLLLEKETSRAFKDRYIDVPMDVSHASFVASANDISGMPEPLLSRFHVMQVKSLDIEGRKIMIRTTYRELLAEEGLSVLLDESLPDDTLEALANCRSLDGRELKRELRMTIHRVCREFEVGQAMRFVPVEAKHLKLADRSAKRPMGFVPG